jgi:hypothetical protein
MSEVIVQGQIDPTKPVKLLRLVNDNGNPYYAGIYEPGELPAKYLVPGIVSQELVPSGVIPAYKDVIKTQEVNFVVAPAEASLPIGYGKTPEPIVNIATEPTPLNLETAPIELNTVDLNRLTTVFGGVAANLITQEREKKRFINLADLRKRIQVTGLDWDKFSDRIVF